jgi:hypothetical protein
MIDKREYIRELKRIKRNCINKPDYNPEDDIAYLITKFNMDWDFIWMKIKRILSL